MENSTETPIYNNNFFKIGTHWFKRSSFDSLICIKTRRSTDGIYSIYFLFSAQLFNTTSITEIPAGNADSKESAELKILMYMTALDEFLEKQWILLHI